MQALTRPSHPTSVRQTARYRPDPRIRHGAARQRQLRRQRRRRWLGGLTRGFALVWLLVGALLPMVMHSYSGTQAAPEAPGSQDHSRVEKLPGIDKLSHLAISASQSSTTSTPTHTATPTPLPTATPTPTALPLRLRQATAWQATLDSAAGLSHATQTQAAGQYAATQTALPPILTANAIEREITATAAVR